MLERGRMDDKELQMYQTFYDEALATPMDFIIHDCNASYDDKLREAAADGGWGFYGMWWRLVELLTAKDGHFYDVSLYVVDVCKVDSTLEVTWTPYCRRRHGRAKWY